MRPQRTQVKFRDILVFSRPVLTLSVTMSTLPICMVTAELRAVILLSLMTVYCLLSILMTVNSVHITDDAMAHTSLVFKGFF